MRKIIFTALLTLLFVCPAFAQKGNWETVKLQKDNMLVVKTVSGKTVKGVFQSADDSKMTLLKSGQMFDIDRADVERIYIGKKKKSLIGGWLGGIGGLFAVGAVTGAATRNGDATTYGAIGGAVGGAVVGRRLGARIKSGYLIYEAS